MQIFSLIFKQTYYQIIGKVVTSLSTIIVLGLIARTYKEAGVGQFSLALTYLAMFNLLSDFGWNAHVLKEGLENWQKLFGTRLIWSYVLTIFSTILITFLPFANIELNQAVFFGSLAIVGSAVFTTCNLVFQSKLRYDLSVLASSLGTLIAFVLYVFLSSQQASISKLFLAYTLGWLIIASTSLLLVKKFLNKLSPIFDLSYLKNLFKSSWPIAATLGLNVVYFRIDSFLIAHFKTISEVGIYNVAYSVFQAALVIPAFVMNAYYPLMLKSQSKIKLIGLGLFLLSIAVTITTLFFSPQITNLLTGGTFAGAAESLKILSLGFPGFFLSALLMWVLVTKDRYKSMLLVYLLGLLINLGLNIIFIPKYSFIGASWITVVSEYLILLMQAVVLFRK